MNRTGVAIAQRCGNFLYVCGDEPNCIPFLELSQTFSLRMWRWTAGWLLQTAEPDIFSTYVEMNRFAESPSLPQSHFLYVCGDEPWKDFAPSAKRHFLYVCGDEPIDATEETSVTAFSLRMWRWTVGYIDESDFRSIFSTYVEMNRCDDADAVIARDFLYVCGDEPTSDWDAVTRKQFSLRMWRWTDNPPPCSQDFHIFSTYVEMNRRRSQVRRLEADFLYVCGDEPNANWICARKRWFSLRMWRWTERETRRPPRHRIFSTYVEMNRISLRAELEKENFLYVCGDEPLDGEFVAFNVEFSLRMWRWTVGG